MQILPRTLSALAARRTNDLFFFMIFACVHCEPTERTIYISHLSLTNVHTRKHSSINKIQNTYCTICRTNMKKNPFHLLLLCFYFFFVVQKIKCIKHLHENNRRRIEWRARVHNWNILTTKNYSTRAWCIFVCQLRGFLPPYQPHPLGMIIVRFIHYRNEAHRSMRAVVRAPV